MRILKSVPLFLGVSFLLCLTGCKKSYVSVSQQWVDGSYLASSSVGTPDPRQSDPPTGQMLVVEWMMPSDQVRKLKPHIELEMIFWDYTTKKVIYPIDYRMDWAAYRCFNEEYKKTGGILTYKASIIAEDGYIFREWKHQLWVNLIQVDTDSEVQAE